MNKFIGLFLISFFLPLHFLFAQAFKLGVWDPSTASPYKIPQQFQSLLKEYRKDWIRLTNLSFSGLHWNQGIVVYINNDHKPFRNNYIGYLTRLKQLEDDECVDEEEIEEEEDCKINFSIYPADTIILKENYLLENGVPKQPLTITMMIKHQPGYDPEAGDWQYVQFDTLGQVLIDGSSKDPATLKVCAECHKNIVSRDYIFSTFYHPQGDRGIPVKQE